MRTQRKGTARWIGTVDETDLQEGTALLKITTSSGTSDLYWTYHGPLETRLKKMSNGEVYQVNTRTGYCNCPDHQKKGVICKHVAALRAALPKIGA